MLHQLQVNGHFTYLKLGTPFKQRLKKCERYDPQLKCNPQDPKRKQFTQNILARDLLRANSTNKEPSAVAADFQKCLSFYLRSGEPLPAMFFDLASGKNSLR